jgi:tRNA dimethylallyltransferase
MINVIVVVGPTASGKTRLAIDLAMMYSGEVISADSMQIYTGMDIGTAKPTKEEMRGVPHHLINFVHPLEEFNVVKYKELALQCINEVAARGKIPIVAGGTGFYINSLIYDSNFTETYKNDEFRDKMAREAELYGNEFIHKKLQQVDPVAAKNIHMNNVKRVIRALEVWEFTNKRFSENLPIPSINSSKYNFIMLGLNVEREYLYERINKRVDNMLKDGLLKETKSLYNAGLLAGKTSGAGIGYKELLPYIKGESDLEHATDKLKQATRNYAKRQITWFKRIPEINWIDVDRSATAESIFTEAGKYIANKLGDGNNINIS